MQEDNSDDEFLASRLLFLTTYGSGLDFDKLFDSYFLGESINNVWISVPVEFPFAPI